MKREDFVVDQTVYVKGISNGCQPWRQEIYFPGVVTKIGQRSILVHVPVEGTNKVRKYRFDVQNDFREIHCIVSHCKMYLTKEEIEQEWKREDLKDAIKRKVAQFIESLPDVELANVTELFGIDNEGWRTDRK